jgi:tyrosine-protein kinase Etk/Wzc
VKAEAAPRPARGELTIVELLTLLGAHRRALVLVPLACAVIAAGVSFLLPRTYVATTRILPPQQAQSGASALLGQLGGGLSGLAGAALGARPQADLYIGMLKSNTVADALIARFDLRARYREKLLVDTRSDLAEDSRFSADKTGLITIEVEARDPTEAAELADAYVHELNHVTSTLAITEASQRRLFFERQLRQTKDKLSEAEVKLREALQAGGIVSVDAQSRATVEAVARLRAEITAKQVQSGVMRGYATADNPDLLRTEQEIAALRKELARLESGVPEGTSADQTEGGGVSRGVANISLLRDVKYYEAMFELVAKQYEIAHADESREAPVVQVLDPASPPERHAWPRRGLIVLGAGFCSLVLTLFGVVARGTVLERLGAAVPPSSRDALCAAWGLRARSRRDDS